jgi:hypothetical protein
MRQARFAWLLLAVCAIALPSFAAAVIPGSFNSSTLAANDDGSTGLVNIGFGVNFYGVNTSSLFVNNNGNVTLDSALSTFTPFNLVSTSRKIIAPFFADVDTRNAGSELVSYGTGTFDGRSAFGVNWVDVGYFPSSANKLNSFQLVMVDRSDIGAGDFDFMFNYDQIQWETGGASGGTNGLGGSSARAGWSNGSSASYELAGSAINGAFLDSGPANTRLIANSLNSNIDGRYLFSVRNGVVQPPDGQIPEPSTYALLGTGLFALGLIARRRKA